MAARLHGIVGEEELALMVAAGYVRRQTHPSLPLAILNYTKRCQYDRAWNQTTRACRGLIYDTETLEVVARPFPKFHNHGEHDEGTLDLDAPAVVTDKLDGSLGILYPDGDRGYAVATRGSFTSDQALHATRLYVERYEQDALFEPLLGVTYLFEILAPWNRIVCDYGDRDDLVLLDALDTESGLPAADGGWPGPRVETLGYANLAAALAAPPRPNSEGLVVYLPDTNERVKIKQEEYVRLHRIVTGLSERTVWQHLVEQKPLAELIEPLPDEFRPWVEEVAARITSICREQRSEIDREFRVIMDGVMGPRATNEWTRRDFAELARESEWAWALFMLLDDKDPDARLLYQARPEPISATGHVFAEDTA